MSYVMNDELRDALIIAIECEPWDEDAKEACLMRVAGCLTGPIPDLREDVDEEDDINTTIEYFGLEYLASKQ